MDVIIHLSKPIKCTSPRVNSNVNYRLWMIMMRQYRFTLVEDVDNGGGYACVGAGGMWEISVLSAQYCWEPKTAGKRERTPQKSPCNLFQ